MKNAAFLCALVLFGTGAGGALAETGQALALSCANCHGPGGQSPGDIPSIDQMSAEDLAASLRAFRSGEREGTIMDRIAKGYTDEEIEALARYLADEGGRP